MRIRPSSLICGSTSRDTPLKNGEKSMESMRESYRERRNVIVDGFNRLGLPCLMPKGAFYVFPNITSTGLSSEEFARQLLETERVAVIPGNAFGPSGEGFVRCSYATSLKQIQPALERIGRFLERLKKK